MTVGSGGFLFLKGDNSKAGRGGGGAQPKKILSAILEQPAAHRLKSGIYASSLKVLANNGNQLHDSYELLCLHKYLHKC